MSDWWFLEVYYFPCVYSTHVMQNAAMWRHLYFLQYVAM